MHAWVRRELRDGHGVEPTLVARLVIRLAAGYADRRSGCHLSVHDDLDAILACGQTSGTVNNCGSGAGTHHLLS
jgi:hypothetical protein